MVVIVKIEDPGNTIYKKIVEIAEKSRIEVKIAEYDTELIFPELVIKPNQHLVLRKGREIFLSSLEFRTLLYLAGQPERVFSHTQIYHAVYQPVKGTEGVDNMIYCLIRSLRKKIETDSRHPRYIHTVRGVGYKFEAIPEECD